MPRSLIIWTKSRALSLKLRYQRTHSTITPRSKCRPLNRSNSDSGAVIQAIIAPQDCVYRFAPEPRRVPEVNPEADEQCVVFFVRYQHGIFWQHIKTSGLNRK